MQDFDAAVAEFMVEMGFEGTLVKRVVGEYDPSAGEPSMTITNIPVKMIILDLTLQSNGYSTKYGTLVEAGDKEIYMQPPQKNGYELSEINPASDTVISQGIEYRIVSTKDVNPNGVSPILYTLYVRR